MEMEEITVVECLNNDLAITTAEIDGKTIFVEKWRL